MTGFKTWSFETIFFALVETIHWHAIYSLIKSWEEEKKYSIQMIFHFFSCLICRVETKGRVFEIKWVPSLFNSDNNKALLRGNNISPREAHGRNEFSKIPLKESKKYWGNEGKCMIRMKLIMIFATIIIIDYFYVSKLHVLWVWSDNL